MTLSLLFPATANAAQQHRNVLKSPFPLQEPREHLALVFYVKSLEPICGSLRLFS